MIGQPWSAWHDVALLGAVMLFLVGYVWLMLRLFK
jgi:hypothetical protein